MAEWRVRERARMVGLKPATARLLLRLVRQGRVRPRSYHERKALEYLVRRKLARRARGRWPVYKPTLEGVAVARWLEGG